MIVGFETSALVIINSADPCQIRERRVRMDMHSLQRRHGKGWWWPQRGVAKFVLHYNTVWSHRCHQDLVAQGIGGSQAGGNISGRAESSYPGPDVSVVQAAESGMRAPGQQIIETLAAFSEARWEYIYVIKTRVQSKPCTQPDVYFWPTSIIEATAISVDIRLNLLTWNCQTVHLDNGFEVRKVHRDLCPVCARLTRFLICRFLSNPEEMTRYSLTYLSANSTQ